MNQLIELFDSSEYPDVLSTTYYKRVYLPFGFRADPPLSRRRSASTVVLRYAAADARAPLSVWPPAGRLAVACGRDEDLVGDRLPGRHPRRSPHPTGAGLGW